MIRRIAQPTGQHTGCKVITIHTTIYGTVSPAAYQAIKDDIRDRNEFFDDPGGDDGEQALRIFSRIRLHHSTHYFFMWRVLNGVSITQSFAQLYDPRYCSAVMSVYPTNAYYDQ